MYEKMTTDYRRTCDIADPEGNLIEIGSWDKPFEEKDAGR
jgi:hypothetical protein